MSSEAFIKESSHLKLGSGDISSQPLLRGGVTVLVFVKQTLAFLCAVVRASEVKSVWCITSP